MKIYMETDMEGASGLWKESQTQPDSPGDYEYGKRCLTRDVNTVVAAAFDNGASQIVIRDGHGGSGLNWDEVDARAAVERGARLPMIFPSLTDEFDCFFLIGGHAMAGTAEAFLDHTQSSMTWFEFKINSQPHGELGQRVAYAGHYGVPLVLTSGDRAYCNEVNRMFPDIVTAEVKYALIRNQCCCHPQKQCQELLTEKTTEAMEKVRAGKVKPWVLEKPFEIELTVQRTDVAERFDQSVRVGPRTFRKQLEDQRLAIHI